jgi:hypothetical protein
VPCSLQKQAEDVLLATVVANGHAFYVYKTARLSLCYQSRYIPDPILQIHLTPTAQVITRHTTQIMIWNKMHLVKKYSITASQMLVIGDSVFLLHQAHLTIISTHNANVEERVVELCSEMDGMMHPLSYLNKLLLWHRSRLYLYNTESAKLVHQFRACASAEIV